MNRSERICLAVAAILIAATGLASLTIRQADGRVKPPHVRGILELAPLADTSKALVIGYHYHLLQRFAAANGQTIDIRLTGRDLSYLDSLRAGTVDIVVIPFDDKVTESLLKGFPVTSIRFSAASKAIGNIYHRIKGDQVPLLDGIVSRRKRKKLY